MYHLKVLIQSNYLLSDEVAYTKLWNLRSSIFYSLEY